MYVENGQFAQFIWRWYFNVTATVHRIKCKMPPAQGAWSDINSLDNYISVEDKLVHVSHKSVTKNIVAAIIIMFLHNNLQGKNILN